jgi:amino acid permease
VIIDFEINAWWWFAWAMIFVVLEGIAIFNRTKGDTLSELLKKILGIFPVRSWSVVGITIIIGFVVWFGWHIAFQQIG